MAWTVSLLAAVFAGAWGAAGCTGDAGSTAGSDAATPLPDAGGESSGDAGPDGEVDAGAEPARDSGPVPTGSGPIVASVSGTVAHDAAVTITGYGFGQKSPAAPYFYDDFEGGESGSDIVGETGAAGSETWLRYQTSPSPIYTDAQAYGRGSLSCTVTDHMNFTNSQATAAVAGLSSNAGFVSYRLRYKLVAATDGDYGVWKLIRMTAEGGVYSPNPVITASAQGGWQYALWNSGATSDQVNFIGGPMSQDAWHRVDMYLQLSDRDTANGRASFVVDNVPIPEWESADLTTYETGASGTMMDSILLPFLIKNATNASYEVYVDNVYFDNTQARVEIGDSPVFADCTNREIQIPTAWSDDGRSVEVVVKQGAFQAGDSVYLFVVGADGNVSDGFPVTVGAA